MKKRQVTNLALAGPVSASQFVPCQAGTVRTARCYNTPAGVQNGSPVIITSTYRMVGSEPRMAY